MSRSRTRATRVDDETDRRIVEVEEATGLSRSGVVEALLLAGLRLVETEGPGALQGGRKPRSARGSVSQLRPANDGPAAQADDETHKRLRRLEDLVAQLASGTSTPGWRPRKLANAA